MNEKDLVAEDKKKKSINLRPIAEAGIIAAIYAVASMSLAPFTYGTVQLRVAESLTILPVYKKSAIYGVVIGCLITNLYGSLSGANILGPLDVLFGTMATLISAILTYAFRKYTIKGLPVLSTIPPVVINALVVGLEITFVTAGGFKFNVFLINFLSVAAGQSIACILLGLILAKVFTKFSHKQNSTI